MECNLIHMEHLKVLLNKEDAIKLANEINNDKILRI